MRHCTCDPSLPPYEGLMRIGFGKFDNYDEIWLDGIVDEFGVSGEDETVATDV